MTPIRRTQAWLPNVLFNDLLNDNWSIQGTATSPALNIVEKNNGFRVEVAVPGLAKEDIKIDVNKDNELLISGEKKALSEETQERYLRKEFVYTGFVKTLSLPDDVNKDAIAAAYENGVLLVEIPRKAKDESEDTRSITIA